jgi:hypothetical protein
MPGFLEDTLTPDELDLFHSLDRPVKIQAFLDTIEYPATERNRCPLNVIHDRQGHCLDGALFAAAALRRLGYPPLLVDIFPDAGMDDDHVLAVFRKNECWGAVAKSNFVGLRYREPVYRNLRELAMAYFEFYFNVNGVKTLRTFTRPLYLRRLDHQGWEYQDAGADAVERCLLGQRRYPLISIDAAAGLELVDPLTYKAGTLATNPAGLYQPDSDHIPAIGGANNSSI